MESKFITDLRYADMICVLMTDGSKKIIHPMERFFLDIERELNSDEYVEFVKELGFVEGAMVSHWGNKPSRIMSIVKGTGGYVQPSFWTDALRTKHFPNGRLAQFYNHTLEVEIPTEFYHYGFKGKHPRHVKLPEPRKSGYYWCNLDGKWDIFTFSLVEDSPSWYDGMHNSYKESDFTQIDERQIVRK